MGKPQKKNKQEGRALTGLERLGLRVSEMISHPVAQVRRWVTIHRLDADGDPEWEEVMGLLSETDELEMTFNDDGSVTLRWERMKEECQAVGGEDLEVEAEAAPF